MWAFALLASNVLLDIGEKLEFTGFEHAYVQMYMYNWIQS